MTAQQLIDKRYRIRSTLRRNGILPSYQHPMTPEEKVIDDRIAANDFTVYDELRSAGKIKPGTSSPQPENKELHERDMKIYLLKLRGILPSENEPLNEDQQNILDKIDNEYRKFLDKPKYTRVNSTTALSPEYRMWRKIRERHNISECNLELSDIVIPDYCPYREVKLLTSPEHCYHNDYYSIDRIDSTKGYMKGNIQIISRLANTMKSSATISQLLEFAKGVIKIHGNNKFINEFFSGKNFQNFPVVLAQDFYEGRYS